MAPISMVGMKKFGGEVCVSWSMLKSLPTKRAGWPNTTHYIDPYDTHMDQKAHFLFSITLYSHVHEERGMGGYQKKAWWVSLHENKMETAITGFFT